LTSHTPAQTDPDEDTVTAEGSLVVNVIVGCVVSAVPLASTTLADILLTEPSVKSRLDGVMLILAGF
jgi:hypothetical protein